jgi:tRNA(Ile)-lysidine synthase
MDLLQAFKDFVEKERLFSAGDLLLLAVSGGIDSVVLCELCHRAGYAFAMAHGNFQLRGEESERDEQFVRGLAVGYGVGLSVRRFETSEYAASRKVSVQAAARELRYAWFRKLIGDPASPGYKAGRIVTAHHQDDNVETLLMNFFKGTGIAGLHGILPKQGVLVRPLLFAGKEELKRFALHHGLDWVEDSSNQTDTYTRNYVRLRLIPVMEKIYPGAGGNLADNILRFRDAEILYRQAVQVHKHKLLEIRGDEIHIPVLKLKKSVPLNTIVYEIVQEFGFSPRQVEEVVHLLDSGTGKTVSSSTHRILKNRNWLIISPHAALASSAAADNLLIGEGERVVEYAGGNLRLETVDTAAGGMGDAGSGKIGMEGSKTIAWLDAAAILFPLLLRKWRKGDYFYPLGLRKKKKLGRFFIDNKLSLADKERVWVIEMDKKIIWVVGYRIDDRFRVTEGTRKILKIETRMA